MRIICQRSLWSRLSDSTKLLINRNPRTLPQSPRIFSRQLSLTTANLCTRDVNRMAQGGNKLRFEKSPYLLQHAGNPINWYPYGPEAIAAAKEQDKIIFLSVGYATCHWCHVMEKESFEKQDVADIMNEHFIAIKVDREERPDIDKIYMKFLLMMNRGSGGWPMSIWMTPDLTPITAGTYFPPEGRWGVPGFKQVLLHIAQKWQDERDDLMATGKTVIKIMQKQVDGDMDEEEASSTGTPASIERTFNDTVKILQYTFDKTWGGFNGAPKFPEVTKLNFLLHAYLQTREKVLLDAVTHTLQRIAKGGIHDHVFGGFSRYAVDRKWHVPHFEKMLYDQAQLLTIFSNIYKVTRENFYLEQCEKTFEYLVTDLRHAEGAFYSGEDADSLPSHTSKDKIEGAFYAWSYDEIRELFEQAAPGRFPGCPEPEMNLKIFCDYFDVQEAGNVTPDNDPHGHFLEKNILFVKDSMDDLAKKYPSVDVKKVIQVGCEVLNEERKTRPRPELDTKMICSWNGLMLSGLSNLVSVAEGEKRERYLKCAQQLADFMKKNFYCAETKTLRRSCYGEKEKLAESHRISGFLDDYAFLIRGLLNFYLVTLDSSVLVWAKDLQETQDRLFYDQTHGGYYYTEEGAENVVVRLKEEHDGAEPCGNSISVTNLLQLGTYFDDKDLKGKAKKCLEFFRTTHDRWGHAMPELLSSAMLFEHGLDMLVVVGPPGEATQDLLRVAQQAYAPGLVMFHHQSEEQELVLRQSVKQFKMVNNSPTVYLCHNKVCQLPITDAKKLEETLVSRFEAVN